MPHTTRVAGGRSGLDMSTRHWPEAPRDATSRNGGGTATVTVRVSGCGPVSWISRLVRLPGGTGIRTIRPAADERSGCPSPGADTASRLWARTC